MPINRTVDLHVHHQQPVPKLELTRTELGSRDNPKLSAASQRRAMASFAKTARLFVLLQITVFVVSAMVMTSSVCHGARDVG
ncbi:hypothetical protein PR202_gb27790 [Eleusine coracana subsp. coracana]|uniref:Uncharacterized protein n=1 Tax=Eleusine coracana subsp. coracana TaxID=191504 RepID=A0AAV5FVF6_ELECO|nr:hypothetical protein PR202_gb27790 [Eleusine coracana subsp. coracana]